MWRCCAQNGSNTFSTAWESECQYVQYRSGTSMLRLYSNLHKQLLVGGLNPSEKYLSIGMIIPNIWENNKWQPNHQPAIGSYRPIYDSPMPSVDHYIWAFAHSSWQSVTCGIARSLALARRHASFGIWLTYSSSRLELDQAFFVQHSCIFVNDLRIT